MLYLFDNKQNLITELSSSNFQTLKQTEILNGLMNVKFEIFAQYYSKMDDIEYVAHKDMENPQIFQMYKITNSISTKDGVEFDAVHILFDDLQNYGYLKDERLDKITAEGALQVIVSNTDWEVGNCVETPIKKIKFYDTSRLDALKNLLLNWDVELQYKLYFNGSKITHKVVELKKKVGTETGERFVYGSNAIEVVQEINRSEVVSRIVPRGKRIRDTEAYKAFVNAKKDYENAKAEAQRDKARMEQQAIEQRDKLLGIRTARPTKTEVKKVTASDIMGEFDEEAYPEKVEITKLDWKSNEFIPIDKPEGQEYLELEEITKLYGYPDGTPRTKILEFTDIEDPEELLERAYQALVQMSRPLVDFKTKVLKKTNTYIGDRVAVIRHDLGLYYTTRVFKITRDLLKQSYEIEFGDGISTKSYNPNISKRITLEQLHEEATTQKEFVREVQDQLTEKMYNQDGYNYELDAGNEYGLPAGYYSFNRQIDDNPTKAIYVGAGMMAIANSHKGNGDWDWRSFGTGDGFVADLIVAGMLRGGKVRWNLEIGTFLIGDDAENYSLWWDGATLHLRNVNIDLVNNPDIQKMNRETKEDLIERLNKERQEIDSEREVLIEDIKDLKTSLEITDSKIATSAEQIRGETIKTVDGIVQDRLIEVTSEFTQTADGLQTRVKSLEQNVKGDYYGSIGDRLTKAESKITQTSNSLESNISAINTKYDRFDTKLSQNESEINAKVSKNNIISSINLSPESAKIDARNIDLTGNLNLKGTFTSYSSTGTPNVTVKNKKVAIHYGNTMYGMLHAVQSEGDVGVNLGHSGASYLSIGYSSDQFGWVYDNDDTFKPYIVFDEYHQYDRYLGSPITIYKETEVKSPIKFSGVITLPGNIKMLSDSNRVIFKASSGKNYVIDFSSGKAYFRG